MLKRSLSNIEGVLLAYEAWLTFTRSNICQLCANQSSPANEKAYLSHRGSPQHVIATEPGGAFFLGGTDN
jgi:hypothetical protein